MTMIVKQSVFAVTPRSWANTPELPDAILGCPMTHTPIATLRLVVAWPHKPKRHGNRNLRESKTTASFPLAVIVILLAAAGTFVATTYLSGLLMQRVQHLQQHFNEPRAQYCDVWNWQRHR
jgi:NADH:ubiquinone oxidoreductase subunit 5 (subunit L)/multisubunit Na+/H+ antiporter MnhA subunit